MINNTHQEYEIELEKQKAHIEILQEVFIIFFFIKKI